MENKEERESSQMIKFQPPKTTRWFLSLIMTKKVD
jgi:hypothetical protein